MQTFSASESYIKILSFFDKSMFLIFSLASRHSWEKSTVTSIVVWLPYSGVATHLSCPLSGNEAPHSQESGKHMDIDNLSEIHWKRNGENSVYIKLMGAGGYGDIHKVSLEMSKKVDTKF